MGNIVGDIVKELSPNSKVEFKTPDLVIMVEVMKSNCCLAVLPKYFDTYKKYNLIELSKVKKESEEKDIKENTVKEDTKKEETGSIQHDRKEDTKAKNIADI